MRWFLKSFETREGKPDGRAITVSICVLYIIQAGIADQYFKQKPTQEIFDSFWWIVVIGIGILSPELISKVSSKFMNNAKTQQDINNTANVGSDNSQHSTTKGVQGE
jgi:uncharacterized membrane protein (DUF441 family)